MVKNVAVCLEHHFYEYEGVYYTKLSFTYSYWEDYLNHFDSVYVVARVERITSLDSSFVRADGHNITFIPIPNYTGVGEFFRKLPSLVMASYRTSRRCSRFILRSGNISNLMWPWMLLYRKAYLREYPGNIKEGVEGYVGKRSFKRLLAKPLHWLGVAQGYFSKANGFVSYVLKDVYGNTKTPSYVFSSFQLNEIQTRKVDYTVGDVIHITSVGRLEGEKGHASLISSLRDFSVPVVLHLIGNGTREQSLRCLADDLGVEVVFHGAIVDRQKLFQVIARSDLFVLPSLTEGMPRALLEAVATSTPVIASNVGGVPYLIDEKYLFTPGNIEELTSKLELYLSDEKLREENAISNFERLHQEYSTERQLRIKKDYWKRLDE